MPQESAAWDGVAGLAGIALLAGATVVWVTLSRARALPEGLLQANGRIEGDHVTVASKLATLAAREGDAVAAGQVLTVLDDAQATGAVRARRPS